MGLFGCFKWIGFMEGISIEFLTLWEIQGEGMHVDISLGLYFPLFFVLFIFCSDFALIPKRYHITTGPQSEGWKHGWAKMSQLAEQENKSESWEWNVLFYICKSIVKEQNEVDVMPQQCPAAALHIWGHLMAHVMTCFVVRHNESYHIGWFTFSIWSGSFLLSLYGSTLSLPTAVFSRYS